LPSKTMAVGDVVTLGLVAAAIFAVLDLVAPAIAPFCSSGYWTRCRFPIDWLPGIKYKYKKLFAF